MTRNLKLLLAASLLCGAIVIAQLPAQNSYPMSHHPNLDAAVQLTEQAIQKIQAARKANDNDLGGHGQKAEQLLQQADEQLKLAAEAANANHK